MDGGAAQRSCEALLIKARPSARRHAAPHPARQQDRGLVGKRRRSTFGSAARRRAPVTARPVTRGSGDCGTQRNANAHHEVSGGR